MTKGGWSGEGIEDLSGGVSTLVFPTYILDKGSFWEELSRVNQDFLFTCATPHWADDGKSLPQKLLRAQGLVGSHAYSIMKAAKVEGKRMVLIYNLWGRTEWSGTWGDGSKEWTPEVRAFF